MVNGALGFKWAERRSDPAYKPINRIFRTGSGTKPVLKALPRPVALAGAKGDPLAPVGNTNRC